MNEKFRGETPLYAVINEDGTYVGRFCISLEEALEMTASSYQKRYGFELKEVAE